MESLTSPHYTIQTLDFSTRFTIRTAKINCSSLILSVWLIGWAVGEIFAIRTLVNGVIQYQSAGESSLVASSLFMLVWLAIWTVGGVTALFTFLWQVAGSEVVEISHDAFKIGRKVFGWGPSKNYNPINIDNLRVDESEPVVSSRFGSFSKTRSSRAGSLVFDYGGSQVHFGSGLDSGEAALIRAEIQSRYPQYRTRQIR